MTITLVVGKPFSTNAMYRSFSRGKGLTTIKSKAYREWEFATICDIKRQNPARVFGRYELEIVLPAANRIDADNTAKSFLDCLRKCGVVVDDSPKYLRRLTVTHGADTDTKIIIIPETNDGVERQ